MKGFGFFRPPYSEEEAEWEQEELESDTLLDLVVDQTAVLKLLQNNSIMYRKQLQAAQ